ncbi:MAG: NuoM family protein [Bacteroidota bacterium]
MILIFLPVLASIIFALFGRKFNQWIAFVFAAIPMIFAVNLFYTSGDTSSFLRNTLVDYPWLSQNFRFTLGYDGITGLLLLLTNGLIPLIVLSGIREDENRVRNTALTLIMQGALNGVFMARDGLMFYIFWELALLPIYFITLSMKHGNAFKITLRFFLFTFIGSLAMLASLMYIVIFKTNFSFAYADIINASYSLNESIWLGGGFLMAFAVKIPIIPFHSWQADTYTHSPSVGSMLLSAIMLKMGLYGLIRWYLPVFPESIEYYKPIVLSLSVAGVLYGAIIALRQQDLKRLIAFSSLSHVGLIAAGIFTLSATGLEGAVLQMIVHGINVFGLFLAIEIIETHTGSRNLVDLGGLAKNNRWFTIAFVVMALGAAAVPLTNGFPGEFLLLKSIFDERATLAVIAGITIILGAAYMLRMLQFSLFGEGDGVIKSLNLGQLISLVVVVFFVLFLGLFPQVILDSVQLSINSIIEMIKAKGVLS